MAASIVRAFIQWQRKLSEQFDSYLPTAYQVDGNRDYLDRLVPAQIENGTRVYDVGGGKNPVFSPSEKLTRNLWIEGIDINEQELHNAPQGAYDAVHTADICSFRGAGDADYVLCQSLLEHVQDIDAALKDYIAARKAEQPDRDYF